MGPDTTAFRVEGSQLLQVFSAYLGIDTTTGSCPAAINTGELSACETRIHPIRRCNSVAVPSAGTDLLTLCCQIAC